MEEPNTTEIEFTPRSERRRRHFPLNRLVRGEAGAARAISLPGSLAILALTAIMLFAASIATPGPIQRAEAAPVEIEITSVVAGPGPNQFVVSGTWTIQGNACWNSGSRFHGYIGVYSSNVGTNPVVPALALTDNPPAKVGPEDNVTGPVPPFLGDVTPAPCEGGVTLGACCR